jgi:DNA helicase-2/ATP-dependent DNA helicase PcrA
VDACYSVIAHNKQRHVTFTSGDKVFSSKKNLVDAANSQNTVMVVSCDNTDDEVVFIANMINILVNHNKNKNEGIRYKDIAVLYRQNFQVDPIERTLISTRIPYEIAGGSKLLDRKLTTDLVSYLKVLMNPKDSIAFQRIVNVPNRSIGEQAQQVLQQHAMKHGWSMFELLEHLDSHPPQLQTRQIQALKKLQRLFQKWSATIDATEPAEKPTGSSVSNVRASTVVEDILVDTGWDDRLGKKREVLLITSELDAIDNEEVEGIVHPSATSSVTSPTRKKIQKFLEKIHLDSNNQVLSNTDNHVMLSTIHKAKVPHKVECFWLSAHSSFEGFGVEGSFCGKCERRHHAFDFSIFFSFCLESSIQKEATHWI